MGQLLAEGPPIPCGNCADAANNAALGSHSKPTERPTTKSTIEARSSSRRSSSSGGGTKIGAGAGLRVGSNKGSNCQGMLEELLRGVQK